MKHEGWWNNFDATAQDIISRQCTVRRAVLQTCASLDKDGVDFVVPAYRMDGIRAAWRVRSWEKRGGWEFTTRWPYETQRFMQSDRTKALDWMLYGVARPDGQPPLAHWWIFSLSVWRKEIEEFGLEHAMRGVLGFGPIANGDGTHFVNWRIRRFPAALIVASEGKPEQQDLPL